MKKLFVLATILVMVSAFLVISLNDKESKSKFASPALAQEKVLGVNIWLPAQFVEQKDAPKVTSLSAFFMDSKTGKILYSKNPNQKLPIASLTKVMTVLIALEHKGMDDVYTVSERAANMEPDKMLLIPGEKLTLKELLYGIFLVSANDAAEVVAEGTTGDRQEFINLMNAKAKQLEMNDTYFANPTGLDEDSNNTYSSAEDLALLTRYIVRNYPEVLEISQTTHIILPITPTHQDYDLYSGINLLTTYPGVLGFKTGFTPEAGYTLITIARKNDHEVIGVLLNSEARRDEAKELLDYSFKKLGS